MKCKDTLFPSTGYYIISISPNTKIHVTLGRVRKKNDGRWEWFRWCTGSISTFHPTWNNSIKNSQGVVSSRNEAISKLLEGWPEDIRNTTNLYQSI